MPSDDPKSFQETVTGDEASDTRERLGFVLRQLGWIDRLSGRPGGGEPSVNDVVRGIEAQREAWIGMIRRFSHDLRTPLAVVKTNTAFLRESGAVFGDDTAEVLEDIDIGVDRLENLLSELTRAATLDVARVRLEPTTVRIDVLADRIGSRARSLARGKPLRVEVSLTSTAPEAIECDSLLLDRVVDQLLGSAVEATESGCIAIRLGEVEQCLVVEIADTSAGIEHAELELALDPGGMRRASTARPSWALGISTVIQLLSRVGGRLDVASQVGAGTTFWAHVPCEIRTSLERPEAETRLADAVRIRSFVRGPSSSDDGDR